MQEKESLSSRARNDVIKSSLIFLQAAIGRDKPSQSEFELCAQQIVLMVPEMKDPMPPIRQDAFKQWGHCMYLIYSNVCTNPLKFPIISFSVRMLCQNSAINIVIVKFHLQSIYIICDQCFSE